MARAGGAGGQLAAAGRSIGGREQERPAAAAPLSLSLRSSLHLTKRTGSLTAQHSAPGGPAPAPPALGTLAATRPVAKKKGGEKKVSRGGAPCGEEERAEDGQRARPGRHQPRAVGY